MAMIFVAPSLHSASPSGALAKMFSLLADPIYGSSTIRRLPSSWPLASIPRSLSRHQGV